MAWFKQLINRYRLTRVEEFALVSMLRRILDRPSKLSLLKRCGTSVEAVKAAGSFLIIAPVRSLIVTLILIFDHLLQVMLHCLKRHLRQLEWGFRRELQLLQLQ